MFLALAMPNYADSNPWLAVCKLRATFALAVAEARKDGLPMSDVTSMLDASVGDSLLIAITAIYTGPRPDPTTLYMETLSGCLREQK